MKCSKHCLHNMCAMKLSLSLSLLSDKATGDRCAKGPNQSVLEGTAFLGHVGSIQLILLPAFSIYTNNPVRENALQNPGLYICFWLFGLQRQPFFFCCNVTSYLHFCYNRVVQERGKVKQHNHLVLAKNKINKILQEN